MSRQRIENSFRATALRLGCGSVRGFDAEGICTIAFGAKGVPSVHLVLDDENGCLDIFSEIGFVPAGRESLYRDLLRENLFCARTKGAAFAVDDRSGAVILQRTVDVARLDDEGEFLAGAIVAFVSVSIGARRRLLDACRESGEDVPREAPFMQVI